MLLKLSEVIKKHFKLVLIISALFTILSLWWISKLKLNMQMWDMLPNDEPTVVSYKNAIDNFVGIDLIPVAIEGNEKDIVSYIEDIRLKIEKLDKVDKVIYKTETEFLKKHGLLLLKERELESVQGMLTASNLKDFIAGLNNNFEKEYIAGEEENKISKDKQQMLAMFNTIEDFINLLKSKNPDTETIKETSDKFIIGPKYMISPDRSMGIIFVKTPIPITAIYELIPFVDNLEKLVKANQDKYNVEAGLAGFIVLQRDEMHATSRDMRTSFFLALILIFVIFLTGFRLFRYTILAVIPLIIGIIWAMGFTYVFIGSLNTFTAMMGAILIGLGIDYAIHIINIYTEERNKGTTVEDSITKVYEKSVKGIITGSVTTAIGFMMFFISSFPAFREFGITLGIGIICTLLATIFILPSLLLIFGRKEVKRKESSSPLVKIYEKSILKHPWIVIAFIMVLVILSIARFKNLQFSRSLKDIEPKGLESLIINDKMIEKFDFSNDMTLGITKTIEEAHKLKDQAEDLDTISMVESIAQYIPLEEKQESRLKIIQEIKENAAPLVDEDLYLSELQDELYRLEDNIIEISDIAYISAEHKIVKKSDELVDSKIISSLAENLSKNKDSIRKIQDIFIKNLKSIVLNANSTRPVDIEDLPQNLKDNYIGKDGTYLTILYPEGDVWTNEFQPLYMNEIESINTPLTGITLLNIKVMEIAGEEGRKILLLVVIAIFIVLLIDFRSLKFATFAMIPMVLTLVLLIGVMVWFDIKFNFVNVIALPIIIGIGVDDGVHLIHRFLIERKLLPTIKSTGRGIFLTTITTIAAFGTMIISKYQGFVSFGLLLILGISWAYTLTVLLLSAMIRLTEKVNG